MSVAKRTIRPLSVLIALLVLADAPGVRAEARHAAMVIDANSGQVLHAQAADEPRYPASLTKMMTLYMAFELIDLGRLSYQSRIKISQEAASAAPSKLDLDPGETIALGDAIKALITKSANDIAVAVAEHIAGTEANFARLMTAKARQIGMRQTTFVNASGLPDKGQVTTARDMLTLALRLQDDFPRHYPLFATRSFSYNGSTHSNHNTLIGSFSGADGIKTGYTRASGFNLVSSVRRDGRHVVAAVFGGSTAASRNAQMRALLTRALGRASTEKTRKPILIAKPRPAARPDVVARQRTEPKPAKIAATAPDPTPAALAPAAAPHPVVQDQPTPTRSVGVEPHRLKPETDLAAAAVTDVADAGAGASAAAPRPSIEIARVRRVMVAPRARSARLFPIGETTEEPGADAISAILSRTAAPDPEEPVRATETILPKSISGSTRFAEATPPAAAEAVAAQPLATDVPTQISSTGPNLLPAVATPPTPQPILVAASAVPARPAVRMAPATTAPVVPAAAAMGRAPSTLAQQARMLTGASPRDAAPELSAAASVGGFQIQVGAYGSAGEAERQLDSVRVRTGPLLAARSPLAIPVRKGERQLYRARFAGFDANGAAGACLELRRLGIDCFVMRAE